MIETSLWQFVTTKEFLVSNEILPYQITTYNTLVLALDVIFYEIFTSALPISQ